MANTNKKEKKYQPFTLEYLAYGKAVWELGLYKELPPLLKRNEPSPYSNGEESVMEREEKNCGWCGPDFYKEYFVKYNKRRERKERRNERKYDPFYIRFRSNCHICYIKKYFPKIEEHIPKPWPSTYCPWKRQSNYHFKKYQYLNINNPKCYQYLSKTNIV